MQNNHCNADCQSYEDHNRLCLPMQKQLQLHPSRDPAVCLKIRQHSHRSFFSQAKKEPPKGPDLNHLPSKGVESISPIGCLDSWADSHANTDSFSNTLDTHRSEEHQSNQCHHGDKCHVVLQPRLQAELLVPVQRLDPFLLLSGGLLSAAGTLIWCGSRASFWAACGGARGGRFGDRGGGCVAVCRLGRRSRSLPLLQRWQEVPVSEAGAEGAVKRQKRERKGYY
jgi:hypothetical protein